MKKLCTQCLYIGYEEFTIYGDFKTELVIWGCAFFFALAGVIETFLWVPASILFIVALLYTITSYKLKYCVCPKCKNDSMIPVNSPKAIQIMGDHHLADYEIQVPSKRTILGIPFRNLFLILTTILIAIMLYKHFT